MVTVCGDRILLRPEQLKKAHEVTTDDGKKIAIALEFGANEKRLEAATTEGVVVQIGPEAFKDETPWYAAGDKVLWGKYAGYWVTDPETEESLVILDPHDVLCIISKGDAK